MITSQYNEGGIFVYNICVLDLPKYPFLVLKGHGMIDCPEQFELDVLTWVYKLKTSKGMYLLFRAFAIQKFCRTF